MNGRNARAFRSEANKAVSVVAPAINAALQNEAITRQRVGVLEDRAAVVGEFIDEWQYRLPILSRGFWGRMRWVFLGK